MTDMQFFIENGKIIVPVFPDTVEFDIQLLRHARRELGLIVTNRQVTVIADNGTAVYDLEQIDTGTPVRVGHRVS